MQTIQRRQDVGRRWPALRWRLVLALGRHAGRRRRRSDSPSRRNRRPPAPADRRTPAALAEGQALFRGLCSGCHGGAGRGGKGPDLTDNRWIHGGTDADIARMIQNGVPKTTMKKLGDVAQARPDPQADRLHPQPGPLAGREHLEALHRRRSRRPAASSSSTSRARPSAPSATASAAKAAGSGPALDRIASRRAPEFIMESILQPSKDIAPEYEAVAVATKDGRVITGLRVNETNFSIQLREENGRFHSFLKRDLDEVKVLKKSLMPENFAELLTVKELHDLFAYLMTLE